MTIAAQVCDYLAKQLEIPIVQEQWIRIDAGQWGAEIETIYAETISEFEQRRYQFEAQALVSLLCSLFLLIKNGLGGDLGGRGGGGGGEGGGGGGGGGGG